MSTDANNPSPEHNNRASKKVEILHLVYQPVAKPPTSDYPPHDWINSHSCWEQCPASSEQEWSQGLGTLSELGARTLCEVCQRIYWAIQEEWCFDEDAEGGVACSFMYSVYNRLSLQIRFDDNIIVLWGLHLSPIGRYPEGVRLLDTSWIDIEEVKEWIDICEKEHECSSAARSGLQPPHDALQENRTLQEHQTQHTLLKPRSYNKSLVPSFMVIDVTEERLATQPQSVSYLALSYVWGRGRTFYLTQENRSALLSKGSLQKSWDRIPCTIRDAITLTAKLGFRYLWVDQLCIVQDDEENKAKHIQRMDSIYANASITIVAADGQDSDHGLKGLRGGLSRESRPQEVLEFSHQGKIVMSPASFEYRGKSTYFSRGWTYQEYHLSKRLLVFLDDKVFWRCQEFEWQEGHLDPSLDIHGPGFLPVPDMIFHMEWPNLWRYLPLVEEYNERNLGSDADALSAFSGVLAALNPAFPSGFLQGLPELWFDLALLWQPARPLRRRIAEKGQHAPPSWSWVGWAGKLDLDLCEEGLASPWAGSEMPQVYHMSTSPVTEWHKMAHPLGKRIPVMNDYFRYYQLRVPNFNIGKDATQSFIEPDFLTRVMNISSGPSAPSISDWELSAHNYRRGSSGAAPPCYEGSWPCYRHKWISQLEAAAYPIPTGKNHASLQSPDLHYLYFRSFRAFFTTGGSLSHQQENWRIHCVSISITDQDGKTAGILRLNSEDMLDTKPECCELVAISMGKAHLRAPTPSFILDEATDVDILKRIEELHGGPQPFDPDPLEGQTADQLLRNSIGVYEWYNVLWIEMKDGISYRKALGRVFKEVWEAQALEEVEVTLG